MQNTIPTSIDSCKFHGTSHYTEMKLRLHFKPLILNPNYCMHTTTLPPPFLEDGFGGGVAMVSFEVLQLWLQIKSEGQQRAREREKGGWEKEGVE